MNGELPQGWVTCKLGDVVKVQNGYAFPSNKFRTSGVPLIRQSNLNGTKVTLEKCVYLDQEWLNLKADFVLRRGDVLIGMSGSVGKLCVYDLEQPALQNQRTGKILPHSVELVDSRFIFEHLRTVEHQLLDKGKGMGVLNVSAGDIESLPFRLPPLNEQRRIVVKLEKLLSRVHAAQERLATIPRILKRFRQSVLSDACSGRLTTDWREIHNVAQTASDLISSLVSEEPEPYLDVFEKTSVNELPDKWTWTRLGKLGQMMGGGTPSKNNKDFWNGPIPWVTPKDMKRDRIRDSKDHITLRALEESSVKYVPRLSILFVVRGMILNHTLPIAITDAEVTLNQDLKALVPEATEMSEYLFIASKYLSHAILFDVKEATHGTRRIETQILKNWGIPVPPLLEQQEIVRRVRALFKTADALEARYLKAKAHVDKLTQAILAKAFRGELVPQDPNDEPASVLLERITDERNGSAVVKRRSRR